jgi:hypothetical protein
MWGYPHHVGCQLSDKSIVARQFLSIISSIISLARTAYSHPSVAALLGSRVVVRGDLLMETPFNPKLTLAARRGWKRNGADAGSRCLHALLDIAQRL